MLDRIGKGLLILILTVGVLTGAFLGYSRYFIELQDRTVELCVDLNDVKKIAAYEKRPLGPILDEIKKKGIVSLGLFEETLPEASVLGELYYAKGTGINRFRTLNPRLYSLYQRGYIKPDRTYIYTPFSKVRKRVYDQLKWALGEKSINFIGSDILEVDEAEEELRELGLGLSDAQKNFVAKKGFWIIPRVWNDPHYHLGNIEPKISALKNYNTIIFDGEEILGYPAAIDSLADALKKYKIKYGYIEIVKQDGDRQLRRLMDTEVIRVHSVPKNELKKITKAEAVKRFVRAARERKVKLIYLRPFLPPQIDAYPVAYNLDYFGQVKTSLEQAGFTIGQAEKVVPLQIKGWQITVLGLGVVIGALLLLNYFLPMHGFIMLLLAILSAAGIVTAGGYGYGTTLQKGLALLAAITFPSLAVISTLARKRKAIFILWDPLLVVLNIVAETMVGAFLLIGLLADHRFMLGVETFAGVKMALIVPVFIVALYFILSLAKGSFTNRIRTFMETKVSLALVTTGLFILAALGIFVARSGNFVLPVPVIEKHFRNLLEVLLFIRPRTKEFLIGYPFLFIAAFAALRGKRQWLWLFAALGAIAPISVINSFSHIHTPIMISMIRTVNGLVLGVIIGMIAGIIGDKLINN